jgi:glycine/D-amino acid oxidase-like deaminating enzyme
VKVIVLGAGIVGLWTAELASGLGHEVRVLAATDWSNTTSAAAVAVLTPFFPQDPNTETFRRGVRWAKETLDRVLTLDPHGEFVERIRCYEFGADGHLEAGFPVSKLKHLDFSEFTILPLGRTVFDCDFAVRFDCYLCNTAVFLPWLVKRLRSRGVTFETRTVRSPDDLPEGWPDVVFNCMGWNSVFPDPELFAVHGQSMFVPVPDQPLPHFGLGAGHHAVFKHRRGFYIGSYFMPGAVTNVQAPLYRSSLKFLDGPFQHLCASVDVPAPAVDVTGVAHVNAGVRPFRHSGPRVELDLSGSVPVVHNYGHGAHGWTIGYGTSVEAVSLAEL